MQNLSKAQNNRKKINKFELKVLRHIQRADGI